MPIPWAPRCQRIPAIEHRAITIQQLRDLHILIRRLCKTRLLRSKEGSPISIFDVNMYDIAQRIIKPAIEFEEGRRGTMRRCSWVEFVAQDQQQTPDIMFSHSWAGRFQDFMAIVNRLERSRGFGGGVAIWICTFANSQFGEDFGTGLRDSPFFKAISVAREGVLLVVDRDASSLQRIWCGFELHVTMMTKKPLSIFTSMGQVGVKVTTGPLIEALETWDVTRMEASQDTDRRQILNYLSGGELHEWQGLKTDAAGNLLLVDGWRKQLDGDEVSVDAPRRPDGRQEFAHEACLFRQHADSFGKLNIAVRASVLKAVQVDACSCEGGTGTKVQCLAQRGITLGEFRTYMKRLKALVSGNGQARWEDLSIDGLKDKIATLLPEGFSYAEVVSGGPRTPQYVIDVVHQSGIQETLSAIEWAAEALLLRDSAVLFFTPFCIDPRRAVVESKTWDRDIATLIKNSYGWITVLPSSRDGIVRSNRMQQLALCFAHARPIYFACPGGVLAGLEPFQGSSWEFGNFDPAVARILLDASWEGAQSAHKQLEERVREWVRAMRGGFKAFEARLSSAAAGPVLRHAAMNPGPEGIREVQAVCRRSGLKINSQLLRGALGETPLHIAAAVGNVRAMEILLAAKADPNAEDQILETPLHYAAMSGMATSARLLLTHGAITSVESAFAESPLCVARQNVAGFLGRDTSRVVGLLEAWEAAGQEEGSPLEGCRVMSDDASERVIKQFQHHFPDPLISRADFLRVCQKLDLVLDAVGLEQLLIAAGMAGDDPVDCIAFLEWLSTTPRKTAEKSGYQ